MHYWKKMASYGLDCTMELASRYILYRLKGHTHLLTYKR